MKIPKIEVSVKCPCGEGNKVTMRNPGLFQNITRNVECYACGSTIHVILSRAKAAERSKGQVMMGTKILIITPTLQEILDERALKEMEQANG